jgi:hypothetical protein
VSGNHYDRRNLEHEYVNPPDDRSELLLLSDSDAGYGLFFLITNTTTKNSPMARIAAIKVSRAMAAGVGGIEVRLLSSPLAEGISSLTSVGSIEIIPVLLVVWLSLEDVVLTLEARVIKVGVGREDTDKRDVAQLRVKYLCDEAIAAITQL